jgi:very-short-patch-repair endonuclease
VNAGRGTAPVTLLAPGDLGARPSPAPERSLLSKSSSRYSARQSLQREALLAARAQGMRSAPSPGEARLWEALRGSRLGVAFKRQVVLGNFIADFLAPSAKLIVEVDGDFHRRQRAADERREEKLRAMGFRVVRVKAEWSVERMVAAVREALG